MTAPEIKILTGCALQVLPTLADQSIHCCVTSPPYWGLRDYGVAGQIGLEKSPSEYLAVMVQVFRHVHRVLRDDGTIWVNMGDTYANDGKWGGKSGGKNYTSDAGGFSRDKKLTGLKEKDLCGMPWRLALALQDDGWYLRSDIIWHKPNPMPESCTDRPTKSHEYLFLLSKSPRYFYDAEAIKEPCSGGRWKMPDGWDTGAGGHGSFHRNGREKGKTPGKNSRIHVDRDPAHDRPKVVRENGDLSPAAAGLSEVRNKRTVWTVATSPYRDAHFATFPPDLIRPCILAGCPIGGTVLDPFAGSGTTGQVAMSHGRGFVGIELNPDYVTLIRRRLENTQPGFM